MSGFLDFLTSTWILFLVLSIFLAFGIAGFYVDKNTDILEIEKKKKELRERSMDIDVLKSQIKDKSLSLGGTMGLGGSSPSTDDSNNSVNNTASNSNEDLSAPLNLDLH